MDESQKMINSIQKNIQELAEFCVDLGITNYYDLVDHIYELECFKELMFKYHHDISKQVWSKVKED